MRDFEKNDVDQFIIWTSKLPTWCLIKKHYFYYILLKLPYWCHLKKVSERFRRWYSLDRKSLAVRYVS